LLFFSEKVARIVAWHLFSGNTPQSKILGAKLEKREMFKQLMTVKMFDKAFGNAERENMPCVVAGDFNISQHKVVCDCWRLAAATVMNHTRTSVIGDYKMFIVYVGNAEAIGLPGDIRGIDEVHTSIAAENTIVPATSFASTQAAASSSHAPAPAEGLPGLALPDDVQAFLADMPRLERRLQLFEQLEQMKDVPSDAFFIFFVLKARVCLGG